MSEKAAPPPSPPWIVSRRPTGRGSILDSAEDMVDTWYYDAEQLAFLFGPDGDFAAGNRLESTIHLD